VADRSGIFGLQGTPNTRSNFIPNLVEEAEDEEKLCNIIKFWRIRKRNSEGLEGYPMLSYIFARL
jgi:hypothetical protein